MMTLWIDRCPQHKCVWRTVTVLRILNLITFFSKALTINIEYVQCLLGSYQVKMKAEISAVF